MGGYVEWLSKRGEAEFAVSECDKGNVVNLVNNECEVVSFGVQYGVCFGDFFANSLAVRMVYASLLCLRAARRIQLCLSLRLSESELLATDVPPARAFHKTICVPVW